MIEEVLNPWNLKRAIKQVVRNKGAAGVDGIVTAELLQLYRDRRVELLNQLRKGTYLPQAIRGVEIPKPNGGKRLLGVPTVLDRMLQQAVGQILCNYYDMSFDEDSYGFRPNRNAGQAVLRAQSYINSGNTWIADIDLKTFFDEVDHCLLLEILYRKVKCPLTLRLIRKWLRAPILINGKLTKRRKGVPQGSPLSPILSNILLTELDKELERRGLQHVRYADDFSIYCKTEALARANGNTIYLFLRDKLRLPINREKSGIRRPEEFVLLGYGFKEEEQETVKTGTYHLIVGKKAEKSLKRKLKDITRKTLPYTFDTRVQKLKEIQRGWINYFHLAKMDYLMHALDKWVRRRLRYCIWHNWKKPERRRKNLIRLGAKPYDAAKWVHARCGGWKISASPILQTTITNARLKQRGYEPMTSLYTSIAPHHNEPLYTRPVRTVV